MAASGSATKDSSASIKILKHSTLAPLPSVTRHLDVFYLCFRNLFLSSVLRSKNVHLGFLEAGMDIPGIRVMVLMSSLSRLCRYATSCSGVRRSSSACAAKVTTSNDTPTTMNVKRRNQTPNNVFIAEPSRLVGAPEAVGIGIFLLDQLVEVVDKSVMNKFEICVVLNHAL